MDIARMLALPLLQAGDQRQRTARGVADMAELADPGRRAALFAYVAEREGGRTAAMLFVELVSSDGLWTADYPIRAGQGWQRRELQRAPHRRV